MTPEEAPIGSVVVIGNPKNGHTATKASDGCWYYNMALRHIEVDYDDLHKTATLIFNPEEVEEEPKEIWRYGTNGSLSKVNSYMPDPDMGVEEIAQELAEMHETIYFFAKGLA